MPRDTWQRRRPSRRERRTDVVVGVALALGAVVSLLLARAADARVAALGPGLPEQVAWCLAVALPLAVRRRLPLPVLAVVACAFIALQSRLVTETQISPICLFLAIYTAGAWARDRLLARAARGVVVAVMFAWLAYALSSDTWAEQPGSAAALTGGSGPLSAATALAVYSAALNVMYFAAAWVVGDLAWAKARQQDLLEQRTVELARERDENARRAVLDERLRIARELHDVVAHHVSVMGVQAGAARVVLDSDADATRAALTGIESSARRAVSEMHALLGVLRGDDRPGPTVEPPLPDLGSVAELVDTARQAGLVVDHAVVGGPVDLPEGLALSAYRILQEAFTNTVRHAAATRVVSRVRHLDGCLEIEVVDDGRGAGPDGRAGADRTGLGLVGMRERVTVHGGQLEVGPRPQGGFRVRALLPLPPDPVPGVGVGVGSAGVAVAGRT